MSEEEGRATSEEGARMDDGRQSQKELIRETLQELLGGSPALKAMMAGSPPSQAGAGPSKRVPASGEYT